MSEERPVSDFPKLSTYLSVTAIADKLGIEFALIHKQRTGRSENAPERMDVLVGDVRDKVSPSRIETVVGLISIGSQVTILVDDMIDSGNTLALAAKSLQDNGAKKIYAIVSHG